MGVKLSKCQRIVGKDKYEVIPGYYHFWCPGCECAHGIHVKGSDSKVQWDWNGSMEKPTFSPSYLCGSKDFKERRCHSYIKEGKIQYLSDCYHKLKGQTVELPDWDSI